MNSCFNSPAIAGPQQEENMTQNPFEVPEQMRDLAQKNIEQASAIYGQFMDAMTQAMGMWSKTMPANEMTSGFTPVQERATAFAKQNADAAFALASDLAKAKDMQEVLSLQSRYAQAQMQAYAVQAQQLGQLIAQAAQSVQPRS
jgi:hypothetical protein